MNSIADSHQYAIAGFTLSSWAALCANRVISDAALSFAGSCEAMELWSCGAVVVVVVVVVDVNG